MGLDQRGPHGHAGDGGRTSRYVPLHELQDKYGELYGVSEQVAIVPKGILPRDCGKPKAPVAPAGDEKKRAPRKKGDNAIVKLKATDLIKGFEPFGLECLGDASRKGQRSFAQVKQEASMHDEFLASLDELRCLGTELDLTFEAVKPFSSAAPPASSGGGSTGSGAVGEADEIMLDVELQKFGSTYNVVFRAPQNWELHQPGGNKSHNKAWGTRPKIAQLSGGWMTSDSSKYSTPVGGTVGDSAHTLNLELCERLPENVLLRRCGQSAPRRPSSSCAQQRPSSGRTFSEVAPGNTMLALATVTPRSAMSDVLDADVGLAASQLDSLETQSKTLERNFMLKLSEHCRKLSAELRLPPQPTHILGPAAAEKYAAELVAAAARIRSSTKELSQDYIRDIRSALRLVGPAQPMAARVVEGALKGLLVSLDMSLSAGWQQADQLEKHSHKLEEERVESKMLTSRVNELERENMQLKKDLGSSEQRFRDETTNLHKKIGELKQEIERLSPDQSYLEGVAGLMGEYSTLMQEMTDENAKQTIILDKMSNYTMNVVGDAIAQPSERTRIQNGRVVELENGELLLRPHEVTNQGTNVTEPDLLTIDDKLPIRLRMPHARQIMAAFASDDIPLVTLDELDVEIDKIYTSKMQADQDADLSGLPRTELSDFVVEFYLHSLRSVKRAQAMFCGILRCLQTADRKDLAVPPKVCLFQRFLEFCDFDKSLPLTVLNVVLQAKRNATLQLMRQKPSDREREAASRIASKVAPSSKTERASSSLEGAREPQFGVAIAYEAATKALPNRIPAMREFFAGLWSRAEVDSTRSNPIDREFLVLLLLLHDRLHTEDAPRLHDLIHRCESRGTISADEFREAVRDAEVQAIDDSVWRSKLSDPTNLVQLSTESVLEFFGGGSQARIPGATISESGFMAAVTEAVTADYTDRMKHIQGLWQRQAQLTCSQGALSYGDYEAVIHSEDPTLPEPMLRALYLTAVELSRGCTQLNGDTCHLVGTLEAEKEYGGDVVNFPLFAKAALRCGLFSKDLASAEANTQGEGTRVGNAPGGQRPGRQSFATTTTMAKRGAAPKNGGSTKR